MRQKVEDDINTILGCSNVGIAEKKEHLIVDEVQANDQAIQSSNDDFLDMVQEFFDRIEKVFGYKVTISLKHDAQEMENDTQMEYNEDGEEE